MEEGRRGAGSPGRTRAAAMSYGRRRPAGAQGRCGVGLGHGLAGAGPAQSAGEIFFKRWKKKRKRNNLKYYIGILYIKIFRKRFYTT